MNDNNYDFEQARIKHLLFKSKLRAILYGLPVDESVIISHEQCSLGKWIYEFAMHQYGNIPEVNELDKVHKEIHATGRKLLDLYKSGKVEEARMGLTEMEKIADKLLTLLSIIEKKINSSGVKNEPREESIASTQELVELIQLTSELDNVIKKQSGEILHDKKLLKEIFLQLPASVAVLQGPNHVFEMVNQPFLDLVGNRNLIGKDVREAFPELEGQGYFELLDRVYQTGEVFIQKESPATIIIDDHTEQIFTDQVYKPFKNANGEVEGILCFGIDVTEQVLARKKIELEAETTRFITETMPQKVWTGDKEGNVDYMNQHWMNFTGRSFEDLKQWGWKAIIHPEDLEENVRLWNESIATGKDFEFEHRFRNRQGEYRWHLSRARAQKNEDGNILRWVGTNTDIHDLKLLQARLRESYEDLEMKVRFRNLELEKEIQDLKSNNRKAL